jgi:NADPH:quinone reductase
MAVPGRRAEVGTAAEWTVVPERHAAPLPDNADMELGAMLGVPAITAHRCVFADGAVAGKTVLVAGGAGAVGHFSIDLAKRDGARVIATVSSPEKGELARAAGADLVLNYRQQNVAEEVRAYAGRADRVVEVALGANLDTDLAVSGPETVVVTYAASPPGSGPAGARLHERQRHAAVRSAVHGPGDGSGSGGRGHHRRLARGGPDAIAGPSFPAGRYRRGA